MQQTVSRTAVNRNMSKIWLFPFSKDSSVPQIWFFMLPKDRHGDLHSYDSLSVRSSSLLTNLTQLSQSLGQADEALGLAEYAGLTFFLM